MRRSMCFAALLALLIPLAVWASPNTHKKSFTLTAPVQVENVTLSPGNYQVAWTQMGSNVPVAILRHKKTIVTVPGASVVEQKNPESGAENVTTHAVLETAQQPNGLQELTKIDFHNVAVILPARSQTGR